jgi:hypothetical protein
MIEEISDEKTYRGSGYQVQPNTATHQMNCAGYVMNSLFNTGNLDVNLSYLKSKVLDVFARVTAGAPQAGDVVVFGNDKHIAVVAEPSSSSSSAVIESKDNEQSVVRGKVSLTTAAAVGNYIGVLNDPIIVKNGSPVVYKFVNKPTFEAVSSGDCDPPDLTGQWEDSAGNIYTLTQKTETDGSIHVSGVLKGSARSGHPKATGTLDGTLSDLDWKGSFRNQEPDAAGNIVWSDGGDVTFHITSDDRIVGDFPATLHWDNGASTREFVIHLDYKRVSP